MSTEYSDNKVLEFVNLALNEYESAGKKPDKQATIWIGRMQYDAASSGYDYAIPKHISALRAALRGTQEEPTKPIDPNLSPALAWELIQQTNRDFTVFVNGPFFSEEDASGAADFLLDTYKSVLGAAGFEVRRQRNPSKLISNDKLIIDDVVYDLFTLGDSEKPNVPHFNREDFPPNPVEE